MSDVKVELKEMIVQSVHIDVDPDRISELSVSFEVSGKSGLRIPKDKNDHTFLLISKFDYNAKDQPNLFKATLSVNFYFEASMFIENYDDIVVQQCLPIIRRENTNLINKILKDMGYFELSYDESCE